MLTEAQLRELLADLEADNVERTISTNNIDKFGQAICAFANDLPGHKKPGYLLIGVNDDGSLSGLQVTDQLLQNLGGIRSDGNILPQPVITVARLVFPEGDVAVVEVLVSDLPPVRYKGRVYIRVGPRKAIANEQEERILSERRVSLARSFDAQPCLDSRLDDLALGQFDAYRREVIDPAIVEANHRPVEQQLASLRLYDPDRSCATNAGILLFGKNTRFFFPGAYVQYLKMPRNDLTDLPLDQAEISGDLYSVLRELELRLKVAVETAIRTVGILEEETIQSYPEVALREFFDERGNASKL